MKKENKVKQKKIYHSPKITKMGNLIDNTLGSNPFTHNDAKGSPSGKS